VFADTTNPILMHVIIINNFING